MSAASAESGEAGSTNLGTTGAGVPEVHRHYGYWIDREWGRARCYGCGFQFAGTDDTAEDWQPA
ncbi:hypothetical protein Mycsm_07286 (plasmid) [Mycobacterium sp. JS623]|uniref:hypothetical protein n=1 Tax=Mycobacterium sp. JS623 TaxID=212767 RepID=UPI0002A596E9|nr:hypothetical protein [Mycobacterium sp. JS623]AGB27378.1 hypothetical protein Mycsm_07286 [Mycobacterium sp. JS623]